MKKTILRYEGEIEELCRSGKNHKERQKAIHTREVGLTLANYPPNRVLYRKPPEINREEENLSRIVRTRLARLRSGFCRSLNSYLSRIDESVTNTCPLCNATPHDTAHLFNCPENPTDLEVIDLWTRPAQVAQVTGHGRRRRLTTPLEVKEAITAT